MAVVPIGITEQHRTNLPLASDSLFTQHIAEAIARTINGYLVPMLPFGQSDDGWSTPARYRSQRHDEGAIIHLQDR